MVYDTGKHGQVVQLAVSVLEQVEHGNTAGEATSKLADIYTPEIRGADDALFDPTARRIRVVRML